MNQIWLDDCREAPLGWIRACWPHQVIEYLQTRQVTALELDHDLGEEGDDARTGMDVLDWLETQVQVNGFVPPASMVSHSANSSARKRMEQVIERIYRVAEENQKEGRKWNGSLELPPPYE